MPYGSRLLCGDKAPQCNFCKNVPWTDAGCRCWVTILTRRSFATVLEKMCYLCGSGIREDQISVTRIPIWATATERDPEGWKETDAALAFINDKGEIVTLCVKCALNATKRCWDRIYTGISA